MNSNRAAAAATRRAIARVGALSCAIAMSTAQEPEPAPDPTATALAALAAEQPELRTTALRELARGDATLPVLEAVALALGDLEPEVRRAAVDALLVLREDLRGLRRKLQDIVTTRKAEAVWAGRVGLGGPVLVRLADPAPHAALLADADAEVRRKAVAALCALGAAAAPYEEQILPLLRDPDAEVRATVAHDVGSIGWNENIRDAVVRAMKDPVAGVRHHAAETLRRNGNDPVVVAALRGAVQDPDLDVRAQVLRSLGHCGAAGTAAAIDIVASLRDREAKVRVAALEAVRQLNLRDERAARESLRCLGDQDHKVLLAALQTAAALQQAAGAAMPRLVALSHHRRGEVRRRALAAVWAASDEARLGATVLRSVEALLDDEREVTRSAQQLLQRFVGRRGRR